jgi:hypothetical protein
MRRVGQARRVLVRYPANPGQEQGSISVAVWKFNGVRARAARSREHLTFRRIGEGLRVNTITGEVFDECEEASDAYTANG